MENVDNNQEYAPRAEEPDGAGTILIHGRKITFPKRL
jgi:hypothetical protein